MNKEEFSEYFKKQKYKTSSFVSGLLLFFVDTFVLLLSISIGFFIVNLFATSYINFKSFINYSFIVPIILILFSSVGLYPGIMIPSTEEIKKFCGCTFFGFLVVVLSIFISELKDSSFSKLILEDSEDLYVSLAFLLSIPIATILLSAFREIFRHVFSKFSFWGVSCIIFNTDNSGNTVIDRLLSNKNLGYHPLAIIDSALEPTENNETKYYKEIPIFSNKDKDILDLILNSKIKNAIICDYKEDLSSIMKSFRYTIVISKHQTNFTFTQHLKDIAGIIGFSSTHNLTFNHNLFFKRFLDLFIILLFSPIIIPIMLILAILTKLTSKGPIFYGHPRVGKNGKPFKCWKFRSMCINSQEILKEILETNPQMRAEWEKDHKFVNDPRVTKFGKFLRKTSLDELPQLINILLGDMSFIGPRPVTEEELFKYGEFKDYVLSVSPGLSGMWQVSGRSDTGYEERISFDTYYIQNWSIWLDIWILIKTVWVVLNHKGAY